MAITGTLTLDGGGDPNAVFIFQAGSTLVTAAGSPSIPASTVALTNGAKAANVFWQVGSSATLGTYSLFSGTILALTSITATTGASIDGRLIALIAAVTLDSNNIASSPRDALAPTLTITGGANVTTTDTTPTISGTSDEIGATVTVTITDTTGSQTLTAIVDENGDWTVTATSDLTEGPHTVTASVSDTDGDTTTAMQTLIQGQTTTPLAGSSQQGASAARGHPHNSLSTLNALPTGGTVSIGGASWKMEVNIQSEMLELERHPQLDKNKEEAFF
jgi:hypothetical protein